MAEEVSHITCIMNSTESGLEKYRYNESISQQSVIRTSQEKTAQLVTHASIQKTMILYDYSWKKEAKPFFDIEQISAPSSRC